MNLILMGLVPSILLVVLNSLMLRSLIGHLQTEEFPVRTSSSPVPMVVTATPSHMGHEGSNAKWNTFEFLGRFSSDPLFELVSDNPSFKK